MVSCMSKKRANARIVQAKTDILKALKTFLKFLKSYEIAMVEMPGVEPGSRDEI